jgi:uncharacterized protein (DUF1800 family)
MPKHLSNSLLFIWVYLLVCPIEIQAQTGWQKTGAGSNISSMTTSSSSTANGTNAQNTIADNGFLPNLAATSRFLGQATLGVDYETIVSVASKGKETWLEEQFNLPITQNLEQYTRDLTQFAHDSTAANGGDLSKVEPQLAYWYSAWWRYVMTSEDLLRSRIALALSEIVVISQTPTLGGHALTLANYYDMLLKNSFGNFRTLLYDVTLHPAMGVYLTHINNPKTDTLANRFPDENYAREIMQLFSFGLFELNPDGTRKTDTSGQFIPTYDNEDIVEFSKIFTGLTWGDRDKFGKSRPVNEDGYTVPMKMYDANHEPGVKKLLNGTTIPDRNPVDGMADLNDALDNIFNHPNVGPFIGKLLIQRLVKANPSPAYVARVTAAFNNNGQNVRGDMKAVIRAILLDEEASNCPNPNEALDGMLREPIVRYTQLSRAFNASNQSGKFRNSMNNFYAQVFQRPLSSPSVFNFFQQDFQPIGSIEENDLFAPVFQITNSVSTVGYLDRLHKWLFNDNLMEFQTFYKNEPKRLSINQTYLDLTDEEALRDQKNLEILVNRLDLILAHGMLTSKTKTLIIAALQKIPDDRIEYRIKMAIFLVMASPDYLIFR